MGYYHLPVASDSSIPGMALPRQKGTGEPQLKSKVLELTAW